LAGTPIEVLDRMRTSKSNPRSRRLLRWIFERGTQRLTCGVDQRPGDQTFTLSVVPSSTTGAGIAETFTSAWSALRRHAMIASELRRAGWTLAAYTAD
jgi:hypothetical protein